ncbi:MAG TPA: glycosyltransferase family 9 protein [Phycisphaerae bacterium]|nr:glycosyltransferase family 9 protein [Phycisphaerae bacterium]
MSADSSALIIHGGALGDFVLTLSIVQAMKGSGFARLEVLARGAHRSLALRGGADAFRDVDAHPWHSLFSSSPVSEELKAELGQFDIAVDLLGGEAFSRQLRTAGIRRVLSIDPRPRPETRTHITEQWAGDLVANGLKLPALVAPRIEVSAGERKKKRTLAEGCPQIIFIHPGSGSAAKCWPLENFVQAARALSDQDHRVIFCIGEAECERWPAEAIDRLLGSGALLRDLSLEQLAISIATADLYIGNDSGVTHLAAAVGTPTVAIFGPTSPVLWRPLGRRVEIVSNLESGPWPGVECVLSSARAFLKFTDTIQAS